MKKTDLFDIEKVNDLPSFITKEIKRKREKKLTRKEAVLSLFKKKSHLTVNEMLVGLYRLYGLRTTFNSLTCYVALLYKDKTLKRVKKGIWALR